MDSTTATILTGILLFLGGGGVATIVVKWLSKPVDDATVFKLRSEAKKMAQETAASEVGLLREIIGEVRASEQGKDARITRLEERLDKMEERERHMLTRAAVHEAWDQLAFAFISNHDQNFPMPPPLVLAPPAHEDRDA
jgi:hypothetical protein